MGEEPKDSGLYQGHHHEVEREEPCPGFELGLLISFPTECN